MFSRASVLVALVALFVYWLVCPIPAFPADAADEMRGKRVLLTGASQGIGRELLRELAARGAAHIVISSRSGARLDEARAATVAEYPNTTITVVPLNINSRGAAKGARVFW